MTTIAVSRPLMLMAADSRATYYQWDGSQLHASQCYKLYKTRKYIIGAAGHSDDINEFLLWLRDTSKRRRKVTEEFSAILMSRTSIFEVDDNSGIEECKLPFHAIGSGAGYAMASFSTMHALGLPLDPEVAVAVACEHDTQSSLPIDAIGWKNARAQKGE